MIFDKKLIFKFFLFITFLSITYSTSYQQFRHFNVDENRGLRDQVSYRKMSWNNYDVSTTHKYRFIIPKAVSYIRPLGKFLKPKSVESRDVELTKISFFVINALITSFTSFLLFYYLSSLNIELSGSLIGCFVFITSRSTIVNVGVPMIDAGQNLAIIVISYCILKNKVKNLSFWSPILILTKETIAPLLFLPLSKKNFRIPIFIISLILAATSMIISRNYIDNISITEISSNKESGYIFDILIFYFRKNINNLGQIFSLSGLHNLIFSSYSFFLIFGVIGFFENNKKRILNIPISIKTILPYSIILGFISGDIGRMFFMSFPVFIPYISIGFNSIFKESLFAKNLNTNFKK